MSNSATTITQRSPAARFLNVKLVLLVLSAAALIVACLAYWTANTSPRLTVNGDHSFVITTPNNDYFTNIEIHNSGNGKADDVTVCVFNLATEDPKITVTPHRPFSVETKNGTIYVHLGRLRQGSRIKIGLHEAFESNVLKRERRGVGPPFFVHVNCRQGISGFLMIHD